jgi:hypothetical protein
LHPVHGVTAITLIAQRGEEYPGDERAQHGHRNHGHDQRNAVSGA